MGLTENTYNVEDSPTKQTSETQRSDRLKLSGPARFDIVAGKVSEPFAMTAVIQGSRQYVPAFISMSRLY